MPNDKNASAESTLESTSRESKSQADALLKSLGLGPKSTMEQLSVAMAKHGGATPDQFGGGGGETGLGGFLRDKILGPAETVGRDLSNTIGPGDTPAWIAENIGGVGFPELIKQIGSHIEGAVAGSPPKPAVKKPAKAKPLPSPQDAATNAPESPFTQLAQALASEYLGQVQQLMPLTSGSAIFGPQGETTALANQAANMIPGGGQWIQQQAAQEQKTAAPLQAAMNQVGEAQAQGAIPFANAIANTGQANAQYLEAAPWQQILSELASETAYKAASSQGASAFGATPQNTPAFLQQIFKNLGLAGTASSAGLQAPGAAAKGGAGSTSTATSSGTSQTG